MATEYKDIMMQSDAEKEKQYEEIHAFYLQGKSVRVKEHKSGFPAVTADCKGIHILTNIISLEQWWAKKKQKERG